MCSARLEAREISETENTQDEVLCAWSELLMPALLESNVLDQEE